MMTHSKLRLLAFASLAIMSATPSWSEETPTTPNINHADYDWVPLDALSDEQRARLSEEGHSACRGVYLDPMIAVDPTDDFRNTPVVIEADKSEMGAEKIHMEGHVDIRQGARNLRANEMLFDRPTGQAKLSGAVEVRQPGILIRGEHAEVNMAEKHAEFNSGEFVLHENHLRGAAGNISHQANGTVILEDGSFTSCEPGHESWIVKGERITINPETQQGTGKNIKIEVGGVPILYLPYIVFPVGDARATGFLFPSVGTSEGGLDIAVPYYLNIAPNKDATLTPRFAAGHGSMLEAEYRYLNKISYNEFAFAFLPDDDGGGDPDIDRLIEQGIDETLLRPYKGEDRWLTSVRHTGQPAHRIHTQVDYTKASDVDYFRDLSATSFDTSNNTYLSQSAAVRYELPDWQLRARLQTYQNLLVDLPDSYRQLPRLSADGHYAWDRWSLDLNHEFVQFSHDEEDFIVGNRINLDYELEWNQHWQWGFVSPTMGVRGLAYNLDEETLGNPDNDKPALVAPYFSLDTGLIFERDGGRQTLEPRVYYLYRPYRDHSELFNIGANPGTAPSTVNFDTTLLTFGYHQLFRNRRFAGGDRIGDANQLTLGLTTRWFDKSGSREQFSLSVGQVLYFEDQRVTIDAQEPVEALDKSDLAFQVRTALIENLSIQGDMLYNPNTSKLIRTTASLNYHKDDLLFNLGYRYVREGSQSLSTLPIDQIDTSFSIPVKDQWTVVGRIFYDVDVGRELDTFLGFEYDDCCYRVRLMARRWIDSKLADVVNDEDRYYDNGIFLEVDLKGLASSGRRVKQLLENSIFGYPRQD